MIRGLEFDRSVIFVGEEGLLEKRERSERVGERRNEVSELQRTLFNAPLSLAAKTAERNSSLFCEFVCLYV